jgi:hypothetical protein
MSATPYIGCGVGHHSEKNAGGKKTLGKKIEGKNTILATSFIYVDVDMAIYSLNYATIDNQTLR